MNDHKVLAYKTWKMTNSRIKPTDVKILRIWHVKLDWRYI